jgi:hypothetical protein
MYKRNFYNALLAVVLLSNTIEIKPILGRIGTYALNGLAASVSGIAAGFSTYVLAHLIQRNRVNNIGQSCLEASMKHIYNIHNERKMVSIEQLLRDSHVSFINTLRTITTSGPLAMSLIQKQAIINCMNNKNHSLENFDYCVKLADTINSKKINQ